MIQLYQIDVNLTENQKKNLHVTRAFEKEKRLF